MGVLGRVSGCLDMIKGLGNLQISMVRRIRVGNLFFVSIFAFHLVSLFHGYLSQLHQEIPDTGFPQPIVLKDRFRPFVVQADKGIVQIQV